MSDSGDDFGGYDPTSPAKPNVAKKRTSGRGAGKSRKRSPEPVAGPSSKPSKPTINMTKRKRTNVFPSIDDEAKAQRSKVVHQLSGSEREEVEEDEDEDEEIVAIEAPVAVENGKVSTKGKSKTTDGPPSKSYRKGASSAIVVDDYPLVAEDIDNNPYGQLARNDVSKSNSKKSETSKTHTSKEVTAAVQQLNRLQQKIKDVEAQRDTLSKQLEELMSIRQTEAEAALQAFQEQAEARAKTLEALIDELTSQLARVEPLTKAGKAPLLHFLTREAADEEKRTLEKEVAQWKDLVKEKDTLLQQKENRITELETQEGNLRHELNLEIERSKDLLSKAPRGTGIGHGRKPSSLLGSENPKDVQVVQFYEDLTNLLVISMKFEPPRHAALKNDQKIFTCVYSYVAAEQGGADEPGPDKSLSFTLRFYHDFTSTESETGEPKETDEVSEVVKYTPADLDKEPPEFVEMLDFLGAPFTFERLQLPLFLNTLYQKLGNTTDDEIGDAEEERDGMDEEEDQLVDD